jgi:ectoine hydroxylase-related dioxygenase (phytanoyl-CoA dioxygenase family)
MAVGDSLSMDEHAMHIAPAATRVPVDPGIVLPRPTADLETAKADLDRAGYAILTNAIGAETTRSARQVLAAEIAREEAIDQDRVSKFFVDPDAKNRRLNRLPDRHRVFRDILEHPTILALTKHILGPTVLDESYLVHSLDANVTRPGSGEQFIHLDASNGVGHTAPNQSRFIWCLDEFAEENGATRVVPGSHRWNDRIDMTGATFYESVPAEAPAGSIIIYTDMLLHGTGANISADRERASINFGFTMPWCRPSINFPLVLDPEVMKDTSRTVRQVLGYSSVVNGGDYPWDSASEELRALCVPATMTY